MIDNIKMTDENFNPNRIVNNFNWKNCSLSDKNIDVKDKIFYTSLLVNKSKRYCLNLLLTENIRTKTYSLSINGSIRKWYFNDNSRKDLNYDDFINCIEVIGKKIGFKRGEIWKKFKITTLEIGVTLLLKSFTNDILNCFVKYRNAVRDDKFVTSVYFRFKNYDLILYDKFLEIKKKKILNDSDYNLINKYLLLRFEIGINKVSGTVFKKKYNRLDLLRSNWNELPKELFKYLDGLKFVDLLSKEKNDVSKNIKDYKNRLLYLGMKSIGLHKTIMDFNNLNIPNNKSKYCDDLLDIYQSNINGYTNYKSKILDELEKKTNRLYNKSNIKYINSL